MVFKIGASVAVVALFILGIISYAFRESQAVQPISVENVKTIPTFEDQKFLSKLRKDLGFSDDFGNTVILVVGPFSSFKDLTIAGTVININPDFISSSYLVFKAGNYYINFDHDFYDKLSVKERLYVIAHEAWHAKRHRDPSFKLAFPVLPKLPNEQLKSEVEADFYSLRYVDDDTIINFVASYCRDMSQLGWRVWSVKSRIK